MVLETLGLRLQMSSVFSSLFLPLNKNNINEDRLRSINKPNELVIV